MSYMSVRELAYLVTVTGPLERKARLVVALELPVVALGLALTVFRGRHRGYGYTPAAPSLRFAGKG